MVIKTEKTSANTGERSKRGQKRKPEADAEPLAIDEEEEETDAPNAESAAGTSVVSNSFQLPESEPDLFSALELQRGSTSTPHLASKQVAKRGSGRAPAAESRAGSKAPRERSGMYIRQ